MTDKQLISVIIPTYNERKNIVFLIKALSKKLSKRNFEIIIVDDFSKDGTNTLMQKITQKDKKIKFFLNPPPKGLSRSILFGIKQAKGDIVVGIDADFNHDPKIICKMISKLEEEKLDLVVASRFIKGGGMDNKFRFFFTNIFNLFLRYVFVFPLTDNASGYYAIKFSSLNKLPLKKIYTGYGEYHLRLVYYAKTFGLKMAEIPVFYQKRKYGKSKSKLFKMFFNYLKVAFEMRFQL